MGLGASTVKPSAAHFVQQTIDQHPVVIFSKTWCGYCKMAKKAIEQEGEKVEGFTKPEVIELDTREDGDAIQAALTALTKRTTVPNVFINGVSVGGGDDTLMLQRSGLLLKMIAGAVAARASKNLQWEE
eukprot:comp4793_c0_seq1/m.927 comp4793_c0_seq1/g.927  ORF comp4793_c0_seq1/g.927 comp4793_c0_seq1/m.927 type:complete len:129 (-) comp4793_c0_seq1:380-766(-)